VTMIGVVLLAALLERVPKLQRQPLRLFRAHFATDIAFLVVGVIALSKLTTWYVTGASALLAEPAAKGSVLPVSAQIVVALVLLDLGNYLTHHLLHRFEALWAFHKVHHSHHLLDWLATYRSHLVEALLRRSIAPVLLILIGTPLDVIATAGSIFIAWATLNHTNLRIDLRFVEWLVITPRLHRIHHVTHTSMYNLGTVFSVWDRLLGRLCSDENAALEPLGLGEAYPQSFLPLMRQPFRQQR
jgi:sterol desaturase/sphingolipid hydroxylase (fatty acid hydroxylase superfamily)